MPFTDCISKINNAQTDNAKDLDVVVVINNLIKYSNNYSNTSGILCQYCRDEPAVNNNGDIVNVLKITLLVRLELRKK